MKVLIFDDVVFARGETFKMPGLDVHVFEHADDAAVLAKALAAELIFMDYSMGSAHVSGSEAVKALRAAGITCKVVAISSDPAANTEMEGAGANERLATKALLRSYLASYLASASSAAASETTSENPTADRPTSSRLEGTQPDGQDGE